MAHKPVQYVKGMFAAVCVKTAHRYLRTETWSVVCT